MKKVICEDFGNITKQYGCVNIYEKDIIRKLEKGLLKIVPNMCNGKIIDFAIVPQINNIFEAIKTILYLYMRDTNQTCKQIIKKKYLDNLFSVKKYSNSIIETETNKCINYLIYDNKKKYIEEDDLSSYENSKVRSDLWSNTKSEKVSFSKEVE